MLEMTPAASQSAIELQTALWEAGKGRAVGGMDLLQAGIAMHHGATIVHYDADFDFLTSVQALLTTTWVVAEGTIS